MGCLLFLSGCLGRTENEEENFQSSKFLEKNLAERKLPKANFSRKLRQVNLLKNLFKETAKKSFNK